MGKAAADFTLLFKADGSVELLDRLGNTVWTSDNDEEFAEEFGGETFFSDEDDSEDILDYLDEKEILDASEDEIDIQENDLEDELNGHDDSDDDDDIIDAEFKDTSK